MMDKRVFDHYKGDLNIFHQNVVQKSLKNSV